MDARLTELAGMRTSSRERRLPGVGNQGGQAVKELVRNRSSLEGQRRSKPSNRNKSVRFGNWEIGAGREVCELRQLGDSRRLTDRGSAAMNSADHQRRDCRAHRQNPTTDRLDCAVWCLPQAIVRRWSLERRPYQNEGRCTSNVKLNRFHIYTGNAYRPSSRTLTFLRKSRIFG